MQPGGELLEPACQQTQRQRVKKHATQSQNKDFFNFPVQKNTFEFSLTSGPSKRQKKSKRAICCDFDQPQLPKSAAGRRVRKAQPRAAAPLTKANEQQGEPRVNQRRLTQRAPTPRLMQSDKTRHGSSGERRRVVFLVAAGSSTAWSSCVGQDEPRCREAKSPGTLEPFGCSSAVRHQWKLMGLSSA